VHLKVPKPFESKCKSNICREFYTAKDKGFSTLREKKVEGLVIGVVLKKPQLIHYK
jgi:hypothetical protein